MTAYEKALDWLLNDIDRFMETQELLAEKDGWMKLWQLRSIVERALTEAEENGNEQI